MNTETKYNGWTNFATWKINLEIFDGMSLGDFWGYHDTEEVDAYEFEHTLKEYVEDLLTEQSSGLALDYAMAFISDVNWYEIAEHLIEEGK